MLDAVMPHIERRGELVGLETEHLAQPMDWRIAVVEKAYSKLAHDMEGYRGLIVEIKNSVHLAGNSSFAIGTPDELPDALSLVAFQV